MYTFLLQNVPLWDKGMVHCGICATSLLCFPEGDDKGVHLILVLSAGIAIWKMFYRSSLLHFLEINVLCIDSNFIELPRKDYQPIFLLMATCHYLDQAWPISPIKSTNVSPSLNGLNILTKLMHFPISYDAFDEWWWFFVLMIFHDILLPPKQK